MYVGVIHHIHDPEGFQAAEQSALQAGLPSGFSLPVHTASPDHRTVICVWEGPSVEAVRELVESVVARYSANEYLELTWDSAPAR